jgi:hypothetical protein
MHKLAILIITYKRTDCAVRTIQALKDNLHYPAEHTIWHIADDGSAPEHLQALLALVPDATWTNTRRKGVGVNMNVGMRECLNRGANYILWLEDDWQLTRPFDPSSSMRLMEEQPSIGMVRYGYISPGLQGEVISGANQLWWHLYKNPNIQYTFSGHASLRSAIFCRTYGEYRTDLAPGHTELAMCGHFNHTPGPEIVFPAWCTDQGLFAHIGTESLKDVRP